MAKKAKAKRGVKPGSKRGRYKKPKSFTFKIPDLGAELGMNAIDPGPAVGASLTLSLCEQLEETIQRFENRISNSIGRLNELIGKV